MGDDNSFVLFSGVTLILVSATIGKACSGKARYISYTVALVWIVVVILSLIPTGA